MNRDEFLEKMIDILQTEEEISFETELENIEEWDSLSKMAALAFLNNECGQNLSFANLEEYKTLDDLAKKIGI